MADSGFNLPDGCHECDIPGNRPRDIAWDNASEKLTDEWAEHCADHEDECEFSLIARLDGDDQFVLCSKLITKCLDGDAIVLFGRCGTDPSECPFFEAHVEALFEDIMERGR